MTSEYSLSVIGYIRTPFREKFGIPRQSGLVDVPSEIAMLPGFDKPAMFEGLEAFSHIWVSFLFHRCIQQGWKEKVRPPRLGGNRSKGVFATRSPFRPNHLGLSVVRLEKLLIEQGRVSLQVLGADMLDGTPVVDIKPYVPYVDAVGEAVAGFAHEAPAAVLKVVFSSSAKRQLQHVSGGTKLRKLIERLIALDPRPAYKKEVAKNRVYGMLLENSNIRWRVDRDVATILDVEIQPQ